MADGSIDISVQLDDKKAQAQMNKFQRNIEKLKTSIAEDTSTHNVMADQLRAAQEEAMKTADRVDELKQKLAENADILNFHQSGKQVDAVQFADALEQEKKLTAELAEAEKLLAKQEKDAENLEKKDAAVLDRLKAQTEQLHEQEARAGDFMKVQAEQAANSMSKLKQETSGVGDAAEKTHPSFKKVFTNIIKWGFGIRSIFILWRKLKAIIKESFAQYAEGDAETKAKLTEFKAALQGLKGQFGAAFAPIISAVLPALTKLIQWLSTAIAVISQFTAALTGRSTYKRAVSNLNAVGGAAKEVQKTLLGIDEINKLNGDSGGGGGGGGNPFEYIEEAIDGLAGKIAFNIRDVLFNWDDLTPEQIAKKVLSGLSMLVGGALGFAIGGIPGALIGATAGLVLSGWIESFIFDDDGNLSKTEIIQSLLVVLGGLAGGLIGFAFGGPLGAALGATIGIALTLLAKQMNWDEIKEKWDSFVTAIHSWWDKLKSWWTSLSLGSFTFRTPHLEVDWQQLDGNSILARYLGITAIPHMRVNWYAKGGVVDGATLIGAGEAGKEAIVPLERNMEWVTSVAKQLADYLVDNADRFVDAFRGLQLPAMASGSVVPVKFAGADDGMYISSQSADRLFNMLSNISDAIQSGRYIQVSSEIDLDGRKIGRSVSDYMRGQERANGIR